MSWPTVSLAEVCKIVSGATPRTGVPEFWEAGTIWWATPKDLSSVRTMEINSTAQKITDAGYKSCSSEMLPAGSVLLSSRAPIGYVAINSVPMCTNQGFKSFVPDDKRLCGGYLYYWLKVNREYLNSLGNGATFKELSKATVERIQIPLPPLPEQRRIAAILDKADALRQKRREAPAQLDRLLQAVFVDMFGDPFTNPKMLPEIRLECHSDIVSGVTKGRQLDPSRIIELPYMRVANVQDGYLNLNEVKYIEATATDLERYRLEPGDVLLTEGGDFDKLGRGALWSGEVADCIHQNHVFRVRTDKTHLLSEYLVAYLKMPKAKLYFLSCAKRTTNLASINMTQLRGLPVLLPSLPAQHQFVSALRQVEVLRARQIKAQTESDALFSSLQILAFAGEL